MQKKNKKFYKIISYNLTKVIDRWTLTFWNGLAQKNCRNISAAYWYFKSITNLIITKFQLIYYGNIHIKKIWPLTPWPLTSDLWSQPNTFLYDTAQPSSNCYAILNKLKIKLMNTIFHQLKSNSSLTFDLELLHTQQSIQKKKLYWIT